MDSRPKAAWVKKREMFTQLVSELCARVAVYGWNTRRPLRLPIVEPTTKTREAGGATGRVAIWQAGVTTGLTEVSFVCVIHAAATPS
jgi:hypothetical protein